MTSPKLIVRPRLLRITQLCIILTVLIGLLLVFYAFRSKSDDADFFKDRSVASDQELRCRNLAQIKVNQANSVALEAVLNGLANLDNPEILKDIKNHIPRIIADMEKAIQDQNNALLTCATGG